jgi:predicted nucleic acid-binding protein
MTTAPGDRLFCDTNVLLSAVDRKRPLHARAVRVLDEMPNAGVELCVCGQVLREFLVVSTRPVSANGLGQRLSDALVNAEAILERSTILEETREVTRRLLSLVRAADCSGKQVHDANLVAVMLEHGVRQLVTDDLDHFRRFGEIEVVDLASLGAT